MKVSKTSKSQTRKPFPKPTKSKRASSKRIICKLTSATGILSLLDDQSPEILLFALERLDSIVDEFWPEIADHVSELEVLYENDKFPHRQKAALLVSKVYYHLGSYDDSLAFALGAGKLFTTIPPNEYYNTIISRALDQYIRLSQSGKNPSSKFPTSVGNNALNIERFKSSGSLTKNPSVDVRLEAIVDAMFERCFALGQYKQLIGLSLECHRLDVFEQAIIGSKDVNESVAYAFNIAMSLVNNNTYRAQILVILVKLYKNLKTPDYIKMTQCLIYLNDDLSIHNILLSLLKTKEQSLMAYQLGFDLYESATQQFLGRVIGRLISSAPLPELINRKKELKRPEKVQPIRSKETLKEVSKENVKESTNTNPLRGKENDSKESFVSIMSNDFQSEVEAEIERNDQQKLNALNPDTRALQERFMKLGSILSGDITTELYLQFLIRNNKTDMLVLRTTKEFARNSICHNATIIANGFQSCGTTSDQFLKDNLEWLGKAANWAKFSATASLGVIHMRHERDALRLLASYLPRENESAAGYAEGGALYALGLVHANHGGRVVEYLIQQLSGAKREPVKHGGCLGIGLAALGTQNRDVYNMLKAILYEDDAVIGEAAAIAMGLVMLGSGDKAVLKEMLAYAQESQHEKILRGLSLGIALVVFSTLEGADPLIESLYKDADPLMRRCGMNCIALAYCGTGSNFAIKMLLNAAVCDVHDDVRRAAVLAIGFVMFRQPEQCPGVVSALLDSYHPHVRYGAAMTLGIACSGTGSQDALELLQPLMRDSTPFVRQAALIASAMICIGHNSVTCPKNHYFRMLYQRVINDRAQWVMVKFGAIIAQGIIDAGGRNCTISLQSRSGHTNAQAVVGMFVFTNFWYWFPLSHFLSLSFTPTALIGLNSELKMPKVQFRSNAKPSMFAYPAAKQEKRDKEKEKVESAVLSISTKKNSKK